MVQVSPKQLKKAGSVKSHQPLQFLSRVSVMAGLLLFWVAAVRLRKTQIGLACFNTPTLCDPSHLPAWERVAIGRWDPTVNSWSFVTQDVSGILFLVLPIVLAFYFKERLNQIVRTFSDNLVLFLSASALNGFANELCRTIIQRPRPFVYQDPSAFGRVEAHYTSFYSGHTSFSALSTLLLYKVVSRRYPNLGRTHPWILRGIQALVVILPILTGTLRVVAGRHFPSDVIAGAIAGFLWAWLSVRFLSA